MDTRNKFLTDTLLRDHTCHLMGILNVTPDSFSDGGCYIDPEIALKRCEELIDDGADSIDIGGMASGPGSTLIKESIECERVSRVCMLLGESEIDRRVPISVDTFRSKVAQEALRSCNVSIINDISALRHDPEMAPFIAQEGLYVVIMYSKETSGYPLVSRRNSTPGSIIETIKFFFDERINHALKSDIDARRIILDPGMGAFLGDSHDLSWELIRNMTELIASFRGFSFLSGVSRKRFIECRPDNLDACSKAVELFLINQGVQCIRTHNIVMLKEMIKVINNAG